MLAGGFLAAYAVERHRLKSHGQAATIAWGTVTARLLVLLLKVAVTLGMALYLLSSLLVRGPGLRFSEARPTRSASHRRRG